MVSSTAAGLALVVLAAPLRAAPRHAAIAVEDGRNLAMIHVVPNAVTYQGRKALRLAPDGSRDGRRRRWRARVRRDRLPLRAARRIVRMLLPAADQRLRRRSVPGGVKARLFVNGGAQPVLIVNDLRHGAGHGQIGLWSTITTEAYFRNLRVSQ